MSGQGRLERQIVADCLRAIREMGGYAEKTHGDAFVRRGLPDIVCCFLGRYIALEVKRSEHHMPTPLQMRVLDEVRAAGGVAAVVWSADMVRAILAEQTK